MISSWEPLGLPVAASSISLSESRPASKSWADERALIFREQLGNELCGRRWTRSQQILPRGLRLRSPGHDHASRTNANVTSVKVKDRSERKQFPQPRRLP